MFDFLDGLIGQLSSIASEVAQIFSFLVNLLVQLFQFIWGTLVNVFNYLYKIAANVVKFFQHIWTSFFKDIWPKIVSTLRKVHDFLEAKLGPIIKFLKKYRDLIDRNYRLYIKPILNFLQRVRQVLQVMRLMHIQFAKVLDQKIAQVETLLTKNFLQLRGLLTSMINAINGVVDLPLLFRKPVLVLSVRRVFLSLVKVITGMSPGYFFPSRSKKAPTGVAPPPAGHSFTESEFNPPASSYLPGGDGLADFEGFTPGEVPDDGAVDDLEALDYFNNDLYPELDCPDFLSCLIDATEFATKVSLIGGTAS